MSWYRARILAPSSSSPWAPPRPICMALALTFASVRKTPTRRKGSDSPARPARSLSRASVGSRLLNEARSEASWTMLWDMSAAASDDSPAPLKNTPKEPAASMAACLDRPPAVAIVAPHASISRDEAPKTTRDLSTDSLRSEAARTLSPMNWAAEPMALPRALKAIVPAARPTPWRMALEPPTLLPSCSNFLRIWSTGLETLSLKCDETRTSLPAIRPSRGQGGSGRGAASGCRRPPPGARRGCTRGSAAGSRRGHAPVSARAVPRSVRPSQCRVLRGLLGTGRPDWQRERYPADLVEPLLDHGQGEVDIASTHPLIIGGFREGP